MWWIEALIVVWVIGGRVAVIAMAYKVTKQKAECLFRAGKNTLQQRYIRDESMVEYAYSFRFE